jgi:uncharacterized protein (TIRG00374 family)
VKRALTLLAKTALTVGLLFWLHRTGRIDLSGAPFARAPGLHLAGILALIVCYVLQAVRWRYLLQHLEVPLSLPDAVKISWISSYFAIFLPGGSGGELVRLYYVATAAPRHKLVGISSVVIDRMIGLFGMLLLGAAGFVAYHATHASVPPVIIAVGRILTLSVVSGLLFVIIGASRFVFPVVASKLPARLSSLKDGLERVRARPAILLVALGISVVSTSLLLSAFALAGTAVGPGTDALTILIISPLVFVANSLPISLGGLGVAEGTAAALFGAAGIGFGATLMLVLRVWIILASLPGGLIYLLEAPRAAAAARSIDA